MTKDNKVCIVIPAYNEGRVIKDVIVSLRDTLKGPDFTYEIVVIDDGSKDNTAQQAKAAGATVIRHILNSGAGSATSTGLSFANQNNFDIAITVDADGQHLPKDVLSGIVEIKRTKSDLLIGSRLINSNGMSRVKVLGNKGLSAITYVLFGISVTDSQSGLRVFSKRALQDLRWKTSGYEFCSEMLWRANQLNLSVNEYAITAVYTEYSKSKGQNNWNALNIVKSLIRRRLQEVFE